MDIDPINIAVSYSCLLLSLCVHEAAHAAMADRCGDPSARLMGRLTLNPIKHADPIGTVVLPVIMMISSSGFLFGWAKPVPFNPRNLGNMRRDPVFIALAGPGANLAMAILAILLLRVACVAMGIESGEALRNTPVAMVLLKLVMINFVLMLFNCIPVPPLDGHHVLYYFLPPSGQQLLERIGPFGILIAIVVAHRFLWMPLEIFLTVTVIYALFGIGGFF